MQCKGCVSSLQCIGGVVDSGKNRQVMTMRFGFFVIFQLCAPLSCTTGSAHLGICVVRPVIITLRPDHNFVIIFVVTYECSLNHPSFVASKPWHLVQRIPASVALALVSRKQQQQQQQQQQQRGGSGSRFYHW